MNTMRRRSLLLAGSGAATLLAIGTHPAVAAAARRPSAPDTTVIAWNRALLRIVRTPGAQPATVHASRSFAMLHGAVHDAVVATSGCGRPLIAHAWAGRRASGVAAAARAAHDVLAAVYPGRAAELDALLATDLAGVPDDAARVAGVSVGAQVAATVLGVRAADGSAATPPVLAPGTEPGQWRPAPPALAPAVFTHWAAVKPFVLRRADQFRPAAYPALRSPAYARASNEVQAVGRDASTLRTPDQTAQARFWSGPIWNSWNEIAQTVVAASGADLVAAARAFALLNLAVADAVIAFYDAKYHFRIWRPVSAIRLADTDGNPATTADPAWTPLAGTPADPAYPGAHSVVARTGATVLTEVLGGTGPFTVTSEVTGTTRTFQRLSEAADEAGGSRLFAGVHTRLDHVAGQRLGGQVARFVLTAA